MGLLRVDGLWAGYHGRAVLRDIYLSVGGGEVLVIAGPNGAGKTTLIRCIARLLRPMKGQVLVNGRNLWGMPLREAARLVSYLPPPPPPGFNISVADLVASMMHPYLRDGWSSSRAIEEVLGMVGAEGLAHRRIDELSSGELKRIMLAAALSKPAKVVLLDEPAAHLDLRFQGEAVRMVREAAAGRGVAVVAATHNLTLASMMADRIALMASGEIVAQGGPQEVLRAEILGQVYSTSVAVVQYRGIRAVVPTPPRRSVDSGERRG